MPDRNAPAGAARSSRRLSRSTHTRRRSFEVDGAVLVTRRGGAWYLDGSLRHKELNGGGAVIVFKNRFVNFACNNLKEITVLDRKNILL